MTLSERLETWRGLAHQLWHAALKFPWRNTAITLRERFREDRLGVTASSLTFTTTISLVPLFTVALAIFSAFPMFDTLQRRLQRSLVSSLVPESIARPVLMYLNEFAAKAAQMGWTGALVLLFTALTLIFTIDRKLNDIWRVRQPRSVTQRILIYWAVLTLGPLLLTASVAATTYAVGGERALAALPAPLRVLVDSVHLLLVTGSLAALYRYVPNTRVRWDHAVVGGFFAAVGLELAKQVLAFYLKQVPTFSMLYGTFATAPILLVWIYLAWVIVLLGAVVSAYLPSLLRGVARRGDSPGWSFQLALEILSQLNAARTLEGPRGQSLEALSASLRVDALQLEEPVAALVALDWLGRLDEEGERYVLLIDPSKTALGPLMERLLLARQQPTARLWERSHWAGMTVEEALPEAMMLR